MIEIIILSCKWNRKPVVRLLVSGYDILCPHKILSIHIFANSYMIKDTFSIWFQFKSWFSGIVNTRSFKMYYLASNYSTREKTVQFLDNAVHTLYCMIMCFDFYYSTITKLSSNYLVKKKHWDLEILFYCGSYHFCEKIRYNEVKILSTVKTILCKRYRIHPNLACSHLNWWTHSWISVVLCGSSVIIHVVSKLHYRPYYH